MDGWLRVEKASNANEGRERERERTRAHAKSREKRRVHMSDSFARDKAWFRTQFGWPPPYPIHHLTAPLFFLFLFLINLLFFLKKRKLKKLKRPIYMYIYHSMHTEARKPGRVALMRILVWSNPSVHVPLPNNSLSSNWNYLSHVSTPFFSNETRWSSTQGKQYLGSRRTSTVGFLITRTSRMRLTPTRPVGIEFNETWME